MSDLVDKLRAISVFSVRANKQVLGTRPLEASNKYIQEAANEIERQRKLIDDLLEMAKGYRDLIISDYEGTNGINSSFREEYDRLNLLISKAQSHKPNEGQRDE